MSIAGESQEQPAAQQIWYEQQQFRLRPVKRKRRWVLPLITGLLGVAVGVGGTFAIGALLEAASGSTLQSAYESCGMRSNKLVSLASDKKSITFSGLESTNSIDCVLDRLEAPSSIVTRMGQTRALDGRQEEEWGKFEVSWSYHPDDGLNAVIEPREK